MAKGVKKTYAKLYIRNFVKAAGLLIKGELEEHVKSMFNKIKEDFDIVPSLEGSEELDSLVAREMEEHTVLSTIAMVQKFAEEEALKEAERATYQAMESLIHNLNTMHSRAGAQVPFSSINYGTDTSPEGRMVVKNLLLATKSGLGNGETPIFPI